MPSSRMTNHKVSEYHPKLFWIAVFTPLCLSHFYFGHLLLPCWGAEATAETTAESNDYYSCEEALPRHELTSGMYKEAVKKLSQLLKINPVCGCAIEQRAWCYHLIHEDKKAWKDIQLCLRNPKHRHDNLWRAAKILRGLKNYKAASEYSIEDLKDRQQRFPEAKHYGPLYETIGSDLFLCGEIDRALEYLDKSIQEGKEFPKAYYYRGLCFEKKKQYEEALKDFNKAANLLGTSFFEEDKERYELYLKNQAAVERIQNRLDSGDKAN